MQRARALGPGAMPLVVGKMGLEPTRYCYREILSLLRLPVSPLPHSRLHYYSTTFYKSQEVVYSVRHAILVPGAGAQFACTLASSFTMV